jgi:DNA-binding MarR family transcriptional regulator
MTTAAKIAPEAMQVFLKHAALEKSWTAAYLEKAFGLDATTAKRVAEEMSLAGYIEPVRGKKDTWRNTASGNKLAGVRPPRLTRAKAEELLTDLEDRAAQLAMGDSQPIRIQQVVAFGSILTDHDPIQDIDVGIQLEPTEHSVRHHDDQIAALKALKGRSPALKIHLWNDTLDHMPSRIIWKA